MKLSDKLRLLMLEKCVSSAVLADYTNIDKTTINRILNNSTQSPKIDTIYTLAKFFNIDVRELIIKDIAELRLPQVNIPSLKNILTLLMQSNGNMSINLLYKHTNISRASISDILQGKTQRPNIDTLHKLADYFKISIPQLCGFQIIDLDKIFQVQPANTLVPLIDLKEIANWLDGKIDEPSRYVQSAIKTLGKMAFALKIVDSSYLPDFNINQVLIVSNCMPNRNNFVIYSVSEQIAIYEFIAEKNHSIVLRKAGDLDILVYQSANVQLLGTIIQ